MPDLRPGQYRRLGRIAETNPERAKRVGDRMENRAENKEKKILTAKAETDKYIIESENKLTRESRGKRVLRPDTPLANTPEPITDENRDTRLQSAYKRTELGPKILNIFKKNK